MTAAAPPNVVYLCLEALQPGQAAATHVHAIASRLEQFGLPTQLIGIEAPAEGRRRSVRRRILDYARSTLQAIQALRRAEVAYVRAHPAALPFSVVARLLGKPVVHEVNGRIDDLGVSYGLAGWSTRLLTWAQYTQYRAATALIAVTPGLARWLEQDVRAIAPVKVIPNGADSNLFRPDAEGGPELAGPFALFFGGLVAWHGIDTMVRALADPAWPSDLRLVVVGRGAGSEALEQAATRDSRLVLPGYLPRHELAGLAARALAILSPIEPHGRRDEGGVAPLKLFEGMASGRPVVASDLPYQADIVREHACGVVFRSADAASLAAAVAQLASNPHSAATMGRNGRQAVEAHYDWRYRAAETAEVLRASCRPPGPKEAA